MKVSTGSRGNQPARPVPARPAPAEDEGRDVKIQKKRRLFKAHAVELTTHHNAIKERHKAMKKVEIIAPAGNLASLKAAVDSGADVVYLGFNDSTNARNFEGLNFTHRDLRRGVAYLRDNGKKFYLAVNTFPQFGNSKLWQRSMDRAADLSADAVILAELGLLRYARETHPELNIHLSVQASASNPESINFYRRHFGIKRVVLPRVHTVEEVAFIGRGTDVELECFMLGGLCINIEGRCYLSSFVTGASTNTEGACSPSRFVRFENTGQNGDKGKMTISLNNVLLNELNDNERSPYPTCCKGRYVLPKEAMPKETRHHAMPFYAMEDPESLDALSLLPGLIGAGVSAFKIEGRQRTQSYVASMVGVLREAIDSYYADPERYEVKPSWTQATGAAFEGSATTQGAYAGK